MEHTHRTEDEERVDDAADAHRSRGEYGCNSEPEGPRDTVTVLADDQVEKCVRNCIEQPRKQPVPLLKLGIGGGDLEN